MTDQQLLHEYAVNRSETAFAQLVDRHKDWIYSTCLRRLGDPAMADDATQAVLIAMARKAHALARLKALEGWLYTAARFTALNLRKLQKRRAAHEAKGAQMTATQTSPDTAETWNEIAPGLESALDRLPEKYRLAILLRFYQKKSHIQIAQALGISEDNARKRVARGIERLRGQLNSATTGSASAVGAALLAHGVIPAPTQISASLAAHCLAAQTGASSALALAALRAMFWAKAKAIAATAVLATVMVTGTAVVVVAQSNPALPPRADAPPAAATAPSPGEPIRTLDGINQAFSDSNAEALPDLVDTRDPQVADTIHAMQERLRIVARLRKIMKDQGTDDQTILKVAQDLTGGVPFRDRELAGAQTRIEGDTAFIIRPSEGKSQPMILTMLDGHWKLNLAAELKGKLENFAVTLRKMNPLLEELVAKVEKGEISGRTAVIELDKAGRPPKTAPAPETRNAP